MPRYCHNLKLGQQHGQSAWLGDPMEVALADFAGEHGDLGDASR